LQALFRSRNKRRRQELLEFGHVMAHAFHAPQDLNKLLEPPIRETLDRAEKDPDAWENDDWWSTPG
jgi:hypothetical protein